MLPSPVLGNIAAGSAITNRAAAGWGPRGPPSWPTPRPAADAGLRAGKLSRSPAGAAKPHERKQVRL